MSSEKSRDEQLAEIAEKYSDPSSAVSFAAKDRTRKQAGNFLGETLRRILKDNPELSTGRAVVFSVGSNLGTIENRVKDMLGDKATVISSDIAIMPRDQGNSIPVVANGLELPLANQSVTFLVDILGALWYQLAFDLKDKKQNLPASENTISLIKQYHQKIKPGGSFVIDAGRKSTSWLLEQVFGSTTIPGFDQPEVVTSQAGDDTSFNIYRKISN